MNRWTYRLVVTVLILIYTGPLFAQHTITKWPNNRKGAVSITFDDNNPDLLTTAVPALNSFGLKGTFFLKTDIIDNAPGMWDEWRNVAALGHEMGSHTKSHPNLTSLTAAQLDQELKDSKTDIDQHITTQKCLSLAYPYGAYNAAVMAAASKYYISARGVINALNYPPIDFFAVKSNGDDTNTGSGVMQWADLAEANGVWQVLYIHSLDGAGPGYGNLDLAWFNSYLSYVKNKNLWVDTYGAVVKFIKERDSASVSVVSGSSSQIVLNLTDTLSDDIYTQPLTMRSVVPASWLRVNIQQGGSNTLASTVIENGTPVVYYQAIPDRGSITLSPASLHVSALNPASIVVGTQGFVLEATGMDFVSGSIVRWNGSARTTVFVSATKLQAYIPAADVAAQGTALVSVLNPDGMASNALSFVVNPTAPGPATSVLLNPGFESGVSPWVFYTNTAGSFDNNAAGNGSARAGRAIITQAGANVQLYQSSISLEANAQYTLSFKAYSNTGHDLSVSVAKYGSPYTNYGLLGRSCNIGVSWTECTATFTTSGFTGTVNDGRLMFWLASYAAAGDQYFFDDVILGKAGASQLSPVVINQPWNQTVATGQTATFAVAAGGQAPLYYQWQKNGINIPGATAAFYTTPATATIDSGSTFRCVIINAAGSVTSAAAILIVMPSSPVIATQPSNQSVMAGQTATFAVVANGTAPLYYQWQKNGVNISGATGASYTTPATAMADSGSTFKCVATNALGSVTSSAATLTVTANLPVITSQPSSQTVAGGQTATFTIMATGNGIITYQWLRNGVVIPGANGNSYTTPATTSADSGASFTCVVSSSTGSVTSAAATLTVVTTMPPIITAQPANSSVVAGQTATFTVAASGSVPLSYQWKRNGTNISGATGASYTTPATILADSGATFTCVVSNSAGSVTGNAAVLTVSTVSLSLLSDDFNPSTAEPNPAWRFYDPYNITAGNDRGESTLSFDGANASIAVPSGDTHDLWGANNKAPRLLQPAENKDFGIEVKFGSSVNAQYQIQGIVIQQTNNILIRFDVVSDDISPRVFAAYMNGADAMSYLNVRVSTTPRYLRVLRVGNQWTYRYSHDGASWLDAGTFVQPISVTEVGFFAGNHTPAPAFTGIVDYFMNLAVPIVDIDPMDLATAPVITTQPANQTVTVGQTATFSVVASGSGTLSYQWKRNGTNLPGATGASYTTPAAGAADNGASFTCVVGNSAGSVASAAATLTVVAIIPPTITTQPANSSVAVGQTATFTVAATGSAPLSYQWKRNATNLPGATGASYTTAATVPADSGATFTCVVGNSAGNATSNAAVLTVAPASLSLLSDDFNPSTTEPNPTWRFYDPYNTTAGNDRGESTLSFDRANASIAVPSGDDHDLWIGRNKAPRLLQPAENKDFAVEVKFGSTVSMQYQMQGIVVQQTNDTLIRFDTVHNGSSARIFAAYVTVDNYIVHASQDLPTAPLYLQVQRSGNQWTFRYSNDGTSWTTAGTFTQAITVTEVGFFAANHDPNPAFTSVVDYFMSLAAPIVDLD